MLIRKAEGLFHFSLVQHTWYIGMKYILSSLHASSSMLHAPCSMPFHF
jgi:hypothetical protein